MSLPKLVKAFELKIKLSFSRQKFSVFLKRATDDGFDS
jgi:hypothetical protein